MIGQPAKPTVRSPPNAHHGSKPQVRCASSLILLEAVKAGAGLGLLPCYAADPEPDLVRVSGTIEELQGQIWLVYHADSRNRPAVMTLVDRLDALFAQHGRLTVDHPDP
ncbi:MAG: LysR substrate-binding domain-containing protein [Pseudomonadota bacterium]